MNPKPVVVKSFRIYHRHASVFEIESGRSCFILKRIVMHRKYCVQRAPQGFAMLTPLEVAISSLRDNFGVGLQ